MQVRYLITKNELLFGILKATEEKSRILIRGYGYVAKHCGSVTMLFSDRFLFSDYDMLLRDEGVAVRHPVGGSWHHAAAQHFPLQLLLRTEHPPLPVQAARRTLPPTTPGQSFSQCSSVADPKQKVRIRFRIRPKLVSDPDPDLNPYQNTRFGFRSETSQNCFFVLKYLPSLMSREFR